MSLIAADADLVSDSPPPAESARSYIPLSGAIALASSVVVQWMLIAFIAWGRLPRPADRHDFTRRTWNLLLPERDLHIYVAGIAVALAMIAVMVWGWMRWARTARDPRTVAIAAGAQVGIAIAGLIASLFFTSLLVPLDHDGHRARMRLAAGLTLCAIGCLTLIAPAIDFRFRFSSRMERALSWVGPVVMAVSIRLQLLLAPAVVSAAVLALLLIGWFSLRKRRTEDPISWKADALRRSAILALLAIASLAIFISLLPGSPNAHTPAIFRDPLGYQLRIPLFAMLLFALLDLRFDSRATTRGLGHAINLIADLGVPALIVATVFIPPSQWSILPLQFARFDELHHWNFFAVGPALAFAHGRALVSQAYSQYGVLWPLVFAVLRHVMHVGYAGAIGVSVLYGCVYFIGIYFFLRLLLRDAAWAACGVALAIALQIFSGIGEDQSIIWNFPSSTLLRHPMDVWFLLLLLCEARIGGRRWFAFAGAVCGLAILFELETGIDLLIIFCFWVLLRHAEPSQVKKIKTPGPWLDLASGMGAAATVWLLGMALASRGTLVHTSFWSAYFEGLQNQAFSGFGLLPIADVDGFGMALFAAMLSIYFFAIGSGVAKILSGAATESDYFLPLIAAYGLGLLLLFVGRSHPLNLFHPMIPFALVIVLLLHGFIQTDAGEHRQTFLPWILAGATVAILWSKPDFLAYPSLLKSAFEPLPTRQDVLAANNVEVENTGLRLRYFVAETEQVAGEMKLLRAREGDVAVLDDQDTQLYILSDLAPWSRYTSLFHLLMTHSMIAQAQDELLTRRPRYIIIRATPPPEKWDFLDTWTSFHRFVPRHYRLIKTVAGYDFWRLAR